MSRSAYFKAYYKKNKEDMKYGQKAYYKALKKDPARYAKLIESERLRKRKKFGWKRTYKKRLSVAVALLALSGCFPHPVKETIPCTSDNCGKMPPNALALPMVSGHDWVPGDDAFFRMMWAVLPPTVYNDQGIRQSRIALVVDDETDIVKELRRLGIHAWAMTRFHSQSDWQFEGLLRQTPIKPSSIQLALLVDPLKHVDDLLALVEMIVPAGFLIADFRFVPMATRTLLKMGFEKMPFLWHQHMVWRKSSA